MGCEAKEILFVSDMQPEVDAARAAGLGALLIDRAGGPADIHSLSEVRL
jgi:enolase-phosphatase E1